MDTYELIRQLQDVWEDSGYSKAYMARELNISYKQVSRYLAGTSVPRGLNNITRIEEFIKKHS